MPTVIKIDPVTRIEGHLKIEVTVDLVNGVNKVVDAKSSGTMFRGFEQILVGRDPKDATIYTQRICGVCPVSHGLASSLALESAFGFSANVNGRIMRNLILGANFIQSHILHFYHLAALDYINTKGVLDMAPWMPRYETADMLTGSIATTLVEHYVAALAMRRKAHQMGAIFGGKLPCSPTIVAGGCTETPTTVKIAEFRALLTELRNFINATLIPDVRAIAAAFPGYYKIGQGSRNLIAFGVFDLDSTGSTKLLKRGRYTDTVRASLDLNQIAEYVSHSWYSSPTGLNPAKGVTIPNALKTGAYSWIKAPRYLNKVHEAGPLARMYINGDYTRGISVLDRLMARALEAKKVADAMDGWLNQLNIGTSGYTYKAMPSAASSHGLTEAPRGALGHWVSFSNSKLTSYQVLTPTAWNASPKDDAGKHGPIEQALVGTPVKDISQPVEVLRVIHSFDPCLSCAVHMLRPAKNFSPVVVNVPAAAF